MTGDPDGQQVARVLDVTCLKRGLLRLDGKPMIEWLREQANASGLALPDSLALGANVHQCVFPGGELLAAIRGGATYWRLVYRVAAPREPAEQAGPSGRPSSTTAATSRSGTAGGSLSSAASPGRWRTCTR